MTSASPVADQLSFSAPLSTMLHGNPPARWYFLSIPEDVSHQIHEATRHFTRRGWGAIGVHVRISYVTWRTSIFPYTSGGVYFLPVKKSVRESLHLHAGDEVMCYLDLVDL